MNAAIQDTIDQPGNKELSLNPTSASSDPANVTGPNYPHAEIPPQSHQRPPSFLPPDTVLSSASREWEGMTSQGIKLRRKDTWVVGQGWGRHVRVIDGLGPRKSASTGTAGIEGVQRRSREDGRHGSY